MRVGITYIYHCCFCLRFADSVLVFDIPAPEHRSRKAEDRLREAVSQTTVYALFSHSHADHFAPDASDLLQSAASAHFLVADDAADLYEDRIPGHSLVIEPDTTFWINDLAVSAYASNDLGVAFLLCKQGVRIYFGGDLADWQWPGLPQAASRASSFFFRGMLRELKRHSIHLAFSDTDDRLDNLAGAPELVDKLRPAYFVPMHTFGRSEPIRALREKTSHTSPTRIFSYRHPGETMLAEIPLGSNGM